MSNVNSNNVNNITFEHFAEAKNLEDMANAIWLLRYHEMVCKKSTQEELTAFEETTPEILKDLGERLDGIFKLAGIEFPDEPNAQSEALYHMAELVFNGEYSPIVHAATMEKQAKEWALIKETRQALALFGQGPKQDEESEQEPKTEDKESESYW